MRLMRPAVAVLRSERCRPGLGVKLNKIASSSEHNPDTTSAVNTLIKNRRMSFHLQG